MRTSVPVVVVRLLVVIMALMLAMARPTGVCAQAYDPATGGPPPGSHQHFNRCTWDMVPTAEGAGISGKMILDCYQDELDELHISGKGFKTTGVYTVWLTRRDGPDVITRAFVANGWQGKAAESYSFEARSDGLGNYHGYIRSCPLGKWKTVEIRYHPGGNVADLRTSVPVIRTPIKGQ